MRHRTIIGLVIVAASILLVPSYSHPVTLEAIHMSLIEGDVQIKTEDTYEWVAAAINMPLRDGDRIWVPEGGRAELQLRDGSFVRIDENSSLEILKAEGDFFYLFLRTGYLYVNFMGFKGGAIQIDTPGSSINVSEKSTFRIDVSDDGAIDVSVLKGVVHAEGRSGSTEVSEGNTLSLRGDDYADLHPLIPPDEWEEWNRERDRMFSERRYSSRYLPEELSVYSHDFDRYGNWVHMKEYGYVWTPRVVVSVGWAPYRLGRWVWIAGDYVWISYEPWGWVPYHYGRWIFSVSFGWCWVPPLRAAVYWGPGFVGWVYTPYYVAWVPLAPGEIYYGYGYFGPYSININNINISKHVVKKVYKNVYIKDAVSAVHNKTFITGRAKKIQLKENPFLKKKINIGRPKIEPEKTTRIPVVKKIPGNKLPPPGIKDLRVRKVKEDPVVRERVDTVRMSKEGKKLVGREIESPGEYKTRLERGRILETERKIERPIGRGVSIEQRVKISGRKITQAERMIRSSGERTVSAGKGIERYNSRNDVVTGRTEQQSAGLGMAPGRSWVNRFSGGRALGFSLH